MWNRLARWLRQWRWGARVRIEPHPPLAGDRDERRLERARYEAETRHVGAAAGARPDRDATEAPPRTE